MFNLYVWKQEYQSFWWLSWNGGYLGKDRSIIPGFHDLHCWNLQIVLSIILTLSAASIFVAEGLFIYIYFLLFEENHQNRISRAGENICPTISLFFLKMTVLSVKV